MTILLVTLHVLVCFALIIVVLLQSGKGAEMGASFGASGSQSVFGAGGGSTFMSKVTTSAAIIFMLTSLSLAFVSGKGGSSIMSSSKAPKAKPAPMGGLPAQQTPAAPGAPAAPATQGAPATPAAPAAPAAPTAPAAK